MRSPGGGATQASAGILAPFIEGHEHGPLLDLAVRGLEVYEEFVTRVRAADGGSPFEYRRTGTLEIADTPQRVEMLKRRAATCPPDVGYEWLDTAQLHALEPATNPDHDGALLCRIHGFVAVMPFMAAIVGAARILGATFHSGVSVREVICASASCALRTDDDVYRFDRVLLSAGSWASGLDPLDEIRGMVKPIKGQLVALGWTGPRIEHVLWGSACYIVPWQDSTLLVGATSEDVGFDERPTAEGVSSLLTAALDLLPGAAGASFKGVRVGLRPASQDALPLVRPSAADPRLFYATGHFRNGVLLAPLTANLVADYFLPGQQDPAFRGSNGACPHFAAKPRKVGTGPV
jgi:glycine oxidase